MQLLILGLRRSGTTIVWQTFRQDPRFLSINEPFNPALRELPVEIPNRSRREVIDILRRDPQRFWQLFAPIATTEELQGDLSNRQQAYFRFLLDQAEHASLDITRCHFKLAALAEIAPGAVCVHLLRGPASVVSSHLIPSGSGGFRSHRLRREYGRVGFFSRPGRFNNWGIQEIVSQSTESAFAQRLREIDLDPEEIYSLPAAGRALAYWRVMTEAIESRGPRIFGDRYLRLRFDEFCTNPRDAVRKIYSALGHDLPELDLSQIHPPNPPYRPHDARWTRLFDAVQIPEALRDAG